MQRITVKTIVTKPTKKEGTNITTIEDEKGAKMSAFNDTALEKVHAGDILEVDFVVDGKYTNITAWKLIESKPAPPTPAPVPVTSKEEWAEKDRITRVSIERQVALKAAVEAMPSGETPAIIVATAEAFYRFLSGQPVIAKQPAKAALFAPEDGKEATPKPSEVPGVKSEAVPPEELAHADEVKILAGELMAKFGWKDPVTARKYIEQQTGKANGWTVADLLKVRKAAKI